MNKINFNFGHKKIVITVTTKTKNNNIGCLAKQTPVFAWSGPL